MYSFGSPANRKKPKGRVIQAPKFYLFDTAIANHLLKRGTIEMGSELFSRSLLIAVIPDFAEEYKVKTLILVSTDPITRQMGNITALLNSMGVRWGFDGVCIPNIHSDAII